MPRTHVSDYTRQLADGSQVQVHGHDRSYVPGADDEAKHTPVESHRKARLKEQARARRAAALERGKGAAGRGAVAIRKRGRQSWKLARKGGKRLKRAAYYASKRRRATAACCVVGAVAEVGAGLAWSVGGLVFTSLSIGAATLAGGLFVGGKKAGRDG
jgi:hypothetical protein